jgi:hypothetical protein
MCDESHAYQNAILRSYFGSTLLHSAIHQHFYPHKQKEACRYALPAQGLGAGG